MFVAFREQFILNNMMVTTRPRHIVANRSTYTFIYVRPTRQRIEQMETASEAKSSRP